MLMLLESAVLQVATDTNERKPSKQTAAAGGRVGNSDEVAFGADMEHAMEVPSSVEDGVAADKYHAVAGTADGTLVHTVVEKRPSAPPHASADRTGARLTEEYDHRQSCSDSLVLKEMAPGRTADDIDCECEEPRKPGSWETAAESPVAAPTASGLDCRMGCIDCALSQSVVTGL